MSLTSKNIFAALDTKKAKKKKSSSDKSEKKKKSSDKKSVSAAELERQIFSQPSLSISNWADCDDEDEDMEPLPESWGQPAAVETNGPAKEEEVQEAEESDEEVDLEQELGVELAHDEEEEIEDDHEAQDGVGDLPAAQAAPVRRVVEPERQLSKKELKQKELDELSKVFEELGIAVPEGGVAEPVEVKKKKKDKKPEGNGLQDLTPAPSQGLDDVNGEDASESDKKKKKKKKEKSSEVQEAAVVEEAAADEKENGLENGIDEAKLDPALVAARLAEKKKKAAAAADAKKKLSAAALAEAKQRAKKLAKQKDTKHYNQAPQR